MERRTYLRSLGVTGVAGLAGCLEGQLGRTDDENDGDGNGGSSLEPSSRAVLGPPEQPRGDPDHPIYGEDFPSFSVPDPFAEDPVTLDDYTGDRPFLMTYFFTSCPDGACPALLLRLRRVQEDAAQSGYEDDIGLLAMTFDPERDTPEQLRQYATEQGVDLEAGNWRFLRPESYESGEQLLEERFGMLLDRHDTSEEADGNESASGDHNDTQGGEHGSHDHGEYTFTHYNLIMLVNEDGVVERSYPNALRTDISQIVDDTRTVVGVE